jgi:hypothetical protein
MVGQVEPASSDEIFNAISNEGVDDASGGQLLHEHAGALPLRALPDSRHRD